MHLFEVVIESESPYSQSRAHEEPKSSPNELADAYDERTWRSHLHTNDKGEVYLPPMALKNAVSEAAKFRGERIGGKGQATWTKHFEAGIMIIDTAVLHDGSGKPIMAAEVVCDRLYLNADGKKGSGSRVWRRYPRINQWQATITIYVLDDVLTEEIVLKYVEEAGRFIGLGRFRPRNGGLYGRFRVVSHKWSEETVKQRRAS
jgi:hypothetical protein